MEKYTGADKTRSAGRKRSLRRTTGVAGILAAMVFASLASFSAPATAQSRSFLERCSDPEYRYNGFYDDPECYSSLRATWGLNFVQNLLVTLPGFYYVDDADTPEEYRIHVGREYVASYALEGYPGVINIYTDGSVTASWNEFGGKIYNLGTLFTLEAFGGMVKAHYYSGNDEWDTYLCPFGVDGFCQQGRTERMRIISSILPIDYYSR
ncbi:MAG: hypothetical protein AAGI01_06260 [Myxococcota bacterium]